MARRAVYKFGSHSPLENLAVAIAGIVFVAVMIAGPFFFMNWIVMLLIGGLHSIFPSVPALGFFKSMIITGTLAILGAFGGNSARSN